MSLPGLTDEQAWTMLSTDPLAYIRELAYAHAEKLRDGGTVTEGDISLGGGRPDSDMAGPSVPGAPSVTVLADYRDRRNA